MYDFKNHINKTKKLAKGCEFRKRISFYELGVNK